MSSLVRKLVAEFLGTFWLVFGGCGSAIFAAAHVTPGTSGDVSGVFNIGIGYLGVSFAFGLTVMTMAYAIGHISGCHLNPAVSLGLMIGKRFSPQEIVPYWIVQILGGIAAGGLLCFLVYQQDGFAGIPDSAGAFASNGYGDRSPHGYSMMAALVAEFVLTFFFLMIILGSTDKRAPAGLAPIAIGLGLTLIHLIGIPITNLSVNPARSTGVGVFAGPAAISQLWLFWVAPLLGAAAAGIVYPIMAGEDSEEKEA